MAYAGIKIDPSCAALNRAQQSFNTPPTGDEYAYAHIIDAAGYAILARGNTVPTDASAGFAPGCLFIKYNATGPMLYENTGSATSCTFKTVFAKALASVGTITPTVSIAGDERVNETSLLADLNTAQNTINSIITALGGT